MRWYIRSNDKVTGPFPAGQIQQFLLLGRVKLDAEVSTDAVEWKPLQHYPGLIPDVMLADPNDEHARERLAAARRWADERRKERRTDDDPQRLGPGRREPEPDATLKYRSQREAVTNALRPGRERYVLSLIFVAALLLAGALAAFNWIPEQPAAAQCEREAGPGVNWHSCHKAGIQLIQQDLSGAIFNAAVLQGANLFGCNLSGADLAYADLSRSNLSFADLQRATMKGANLRNADLSQANLENTDLSYANLQHATVKDASFNGTDLSHAIWLDGRTCLPGSVGACKTDD